MDAPSPTNQSSLTEKKSIGNNKKAGEEAVCRIFTWTPISACNKIGEEVQSRSQSPPKGPEIKTKVMFLGHNYHFQN